MSAQIIYNRLRDHGMTAAGACAMLGNMQAESGLKSNIVQRGMQSLTDEEYTRRVDAYPTSEDTFIHDAVGYGLCQWTYWSRKKALVEYAHDIGKSVGDEEMQVDFCVGELKASYANLWNFLCTTEDTYEATSRICAEYERPAVNNIDTRYKFAMQFYDQLANTNNSEPEKETQKEVKTCTVELPVLKCGAIGNSVWLAQILLNKHEFYVKWTDGIFGDNTVEKVKEFQHKKGIDSDGIIGEITWAALFSF